MVHHAHAAVGEQGDLDQVVVAGQRLVDRVVDDLVDEVVQPALTGGTDVHAGALADRFQPFENGDRASVVGQVRNPPAADTRRATPWIGCPCRARHRRECPDAHTQGKSAHGTGVTQTGRVLESVYILPVRRTSGGIHGGCDALSLDDHVSEHPPHGTGVGAADAILGRFGLSSGRFSDRRASARAPDGARRLALSRMYRPAHGSRVRAGRPPGGDPRRGRAP